MSNEQSTSSNDSDSILSQLLQPSQVDDLLVYEEPLDALLEKDVDSMSDHELRVHVTKLRELYASPQVRTKRFKDESETIVRRKARQPSKRGPRVDIMSLLTPD